MSCAEGEDGLVYNGILPFHKDTLNLKDIKRPKTEIMMNLGNPEEAFASSMIPNDGIGLARLEFIITSYIKIHPMALIHPERIKYSKILREIEQLTRVMINKSILLSSLPKGLGLLLRLSIQSRL